MDVYVPIIYPPPPPPQEIPRYIYIWICNRRVFWTETEVDSGTFQRKSGTSVNLSNSGNREIRDEFVLRVVRYDAADLERARARVRKKGLDQY